MQTIRKGTVKNASLAEPLAGVKLSVKDAEGQELLQIANDEQGHFSFEPPQDPATIRFEKDGYVSKSLPFEEAGDLIRLLDDKLMGYQNKLNFKPGEEIEAFVHSPAPYTATLYRHGIEKENISGLGTHPAYSQSVPDRYFVESGLNWDGNFSYRIPKHARPGIYSLLLEAEGQDPFAIPMVVSTPADQQEDNQILVLCSTNNWQTYNIWGGRSRYRNFEMEASEDYMKNTGPVAELITSVAERMPQGLVYKIKELLNIEKEQPGWVYQPLSIRRPHTNCALEDDYPDQPFTNHLAGGEWRVLAWLEQQGIPYDVCTGYELHRNPQLLSGYEALLLSTHSEYWSRPMYEAIKQYHRQQGLWLINVSGNSIYREVDFMSDGSIRCLSTKFNKSVEDETQLIGVRFSESDYGTCAPYKVRQPEHWVFKGMEAAKKGTIFGESSLNRLTPPKYNRYDPGRPGVEDGLQGTGASGWETDKLSSTAPADFTVVAKGQNRWGGADMVVRDPSETRGGVFSASSITFGGTLLTDNTCSLILKNVLDNILETS